MQNSIEKQQELVFEKKPTMKLIDACKIDNGILVFDENEKNKYKLLFSKFDQKISFFIPASGSGSRMFQFLYEFLNQPDEQNVLQIERFFSNFNEFALHRVLPAEIKNLSIENSSNTIEKTILYILEREGLNYANYPKGLIPFHKNGPFILNPFQEHVIQAIDLKENNLNIHFTINEDFEDIIKENIENVIKLIGKEVKINFSCQDKETEAYSFYKDKSVLLDEKNVPITRPSGHGALLSNLNKIDSDLIFIKNIDNVQNYNKFKPSKEAFQILGGVAIEFKKEIHKLLENPDLESFYAFNQRYQLLKTHQVESFTKDDILNLLNRPFRICGMIKNDGQPGGGPFWVEDNGLISKQIIEKAQIDNSFEQLKLLVQSTHFNPVMMVCCPNNVEGKKFDLEKYADPSKYFIIEKKYKGKSILFAEKPGLWNGSMAYWNTVFVEVPSNTFSPVKTVLDLLNEAHLE